MATSEAHRVTSWTPSSGDWDDDSASSSSEVILTRAGSETALLPRTKSGEEVVINLKNLSHADPRRKEITALASEYKKGQRSYKDLKRREAEMTKEVARIRDELRERTLKLQYKEEKERKSGKEYKGRKKKGLDKARQKSRDLQREYEDSTLMLRRLQAEVKDTALQLNERGNQLKDMWLNRGKAKEPAANGQASGIDSALSTPSPVYSFDSSASSEHELEKAGREHNEAWEREREEARISRIEKARARFRSVVTKEDDANAESLRREGAAAPYLSSPQLSVPVQTAQPEPAPEGRGRSRSILDMQKRLGLVPTGERSASPAAGTPGGEADDNEEKRKKEEILARLQKGHGVSFMPFNMQRGMEEREQREKRETAVVAHPSRLSGEGGGDGESSTSRSSAMQTADGRLTYHQRPMQLGKRRPSVLSRRERSGSRSNRSAGEGEGLIELNQHQAQMTNETQSDEEEEKHEKHEEQITEPEEHAILSQEQVDQEVEKMRAELKEEMRQKRASREKIRQKDIIAAGAPAPAPSPEPVDTQAGEEEVVEKRRPPERPPRPSRPGVDPQQREKRAKARTARENDLREEKDMALRELQLLIEENDKLLREMEEKERQRDTERRAGKEVETFLARKLEAMRQESVQQKETIETLQGELQELRQRLNSENDQRRSAEEEHQRELTTLQTDKAELQKELADVRHTLDATRAELDAIKHKMEAREQEWEEMKRSSEREKEEREQEQLAKLTAQIESLRAINDEAEMSITQERQAKAEVERQLEGARMEAEENKRHGESQVREREERLAQKESEFAEVKSKLEDKIREMKAMRQTYVEEKQRFEEERSRTLEAVVNEQEDLYAKDKEIDELRDQLSKEREDKERVHEELSSAERDRGDKDCQLGLLGLKLQKAKQSKQALKQELAHQTASAEEIRAQLADAINARTGSEEASAALNAEREQWTATRVRMESELDQERKARAGLEERLKQLEEDKLVNDEVVKRAAQRMEKQKREFEEIIEREREEKRKLGETLESERKRAAQLERERKEREQLEAQQRQRERVEGQSHEEAASARLREELEMERRNRDTLLGEREKELSDLKALAQDLDRERAEREAAQSELEKEREAREELKREKDSLVALIEIERKRRAADKQAAEEHQDMEARAAKLSHDVEVLQRERDQEAKAKRELAERAKREREALQKELQDKDEEITLKKEKTKLLRQKILALIEENQRIKDGSRREKERDKIERERKRDEESKRAREEKERQRLEKEREREERERIKKEKEKEVQEKERIRKEKQIEVEEKEMLRRQMEREREEKDKQQRKKEQELDELRRDLQEKEIIEKNIYMADVDAYCAGDVPRAALDLHTQLVQYHGTPAQKANFVKKAINAISTSIQREAEDLGMQSYWLSYVATLSHMTYGQGDVETKPGLPGRDLAKDVRNLIVTRSVKSRGVVSRFWIEKEKRNLSRDEVKKLLAEAIDKEKSGRDDSAALTLLHLEAVMLDAVANLVDVAMEELGPVIVPAIIEYRPFLSRRKSMVRREREKDKRRRPTAAALPQLDDEGPKISPEEVTHKLKAFLQTVQKKKVYPSVVQVILEDVAHAINAHLFNTLVQRSELCTSGIGFQIKFGLSPIREWLFATSLPDPARVRDCLGHIEEAANVLVVDKRLFTNDKDVKDIFQLLNPIQILHFLSSFRTDEESEMVPQESLQAVRHTIARANEQAGMLRLKLDPHVNPLPPAPES